MNSSPDPGLLRRVRSGQAMRWTQILLVCLAMGVGSFLLVRVSFWYVSKPSGLAAIWPVNGICLALMLVLGRRMWAWLMVAAFLGQVAASLVNGAPLSRASIYAGVNILECIVAAAAVTFILRRPLMFTSIRDVITFAVAGCAGGSMIAGAVGAWLAVQHGAPSYLQAWQLWAVVDAMGLLVITPVVATFWTQRPRCPGPLKCLEAIVCLACCALVLVQAFGAMQPDRPLLFFFPHATILPFVIWGCVRFDPRVASVLVLMLAVVSTASMVNGQGPMVRAGYSAEESIVTLQLSTLLWSLSALTLAAVTAQGKAAAAALVESSERARFAERRESESHARLRAVFEHSTSVICLKDIDGRYVDINREFERVANLTRSQIVGRTDHQLFPKPVADRFRENDLEVIRTGQPAQFDMPWEVQGKPRSFSSTKFPLLDADGNVWAVGGMVNDITDRITQEVELRLAKEQAEQASRAKSEFLANISHEIRTPLTSIFGYADLMLSPDLSAEERIDHIQTIRRNSQHLLRVLDDVLDMSKIEAGRMAVEKVPTQLPQVVTGVMSLMRPVASGKELELKAVCRTPIPETIWSDPTRLRQILLNLVGNALKFTEVGRVEIALSLDQQHPTWLVIDIADTGIGMTPEQVAALGQPFRQADPSHARRYGGTGLGISISYRLASLMGATIDCTSKPGQGTTFRIRLPIGDVSAVRRIECLTDVDPVPATAAELHAAAGAASEPGSRGTVLVADDAPDTRRLLQLYLQRLGIASEIAENGQIALARAMGAWRAGRPYDLILMDMQMPEMDGVAAVSKLRAHGYPGPILAVTASAMDAEREQALAIGCDDFIAKPVQSQLLIDLVRRYVQPKPGSTEAAASDANDAGAIRSELADDVDIAPLLPEYLSELQEKADRIEQLGAQNNWPAVAGLAHQIKGAAGGYGYPKITAAAADVEAAARQSEPPPGLPRLLARLVDMCRRTALVEA